VCILNEISAQRIKELRERTGATMVDCKNALIEANGDFELAEKKLKGKDDGFQEPEPVE